MNSPTNTNSRAMYQRLLGYIQPYRKAFFVAIICMFAEAATEPVFPAIMKYLLDQGFKTDDPRLVWLIPAGIVSLFAVRAIFTFCTNYLMAWISTSFITDMRQQMFSKILLMPTQTFYEISSGKLASRVLYEVSYLSESATSVLITTVRESFTAVALLTYLIYLDWKLTLIALAIGPVIALLIRGFSRRMRNASRASIAAFRRLIHALEETIAAHKVVKIFGGQEQAKQRFIQEAQGFRRAQIKETIPSAAITPITHFVASIAVAIITFLALSKTTGEAGASAGGFVSFITAMLMLISPIKQLTTVHTHVQKGLAACEGVFALLDSPGELDTGDRVVRRCHGKIEFHNVAFKYPGAENFALKGISFDITAGQTIALVGGSGGGKTTISALIPRFYHPDSGVISIDGMDINTFTLTSLRQNIALVSQDIVLFNDTVMANIAFGSSDRASKEQIIQAAKAANAWEFIQQLPEGLDTLIGEDGAKLSGGQRQRISIARALLKDAPILILDEATSALDTESERQVQYALNELMRHRTTLIIAHRLSTIEHADRIFVLDQGRIAESGTHGELLAQGGIYANLNRMQT